MVTASIVTYNHTLNDLEPTIKSVLDSIVEHLYIIDHSEDKSVLEKELEGYSDRITFIRHKNLGYGSGHNVALRIALERGSDYHAVINPDVWFDGSIIKNIEEYMNEHREVGHLMPSVKYPDGSMQRLCKLLPTPFDLFGRLCLPRCTYKRNIVYELQMTNYDKRMNVPYLSGCFMFLRMDAMREVGLFDEHFFMYAEDVDLTRRIHEKYVTLFYPDVFIYHKFSRASRKSLKLFLVHFVNLAMYFNKWGWFFDKKRKEINKKCLDDLVK